MVSSVGNGYLSQPDWYPQANVLVVDDDRSLREMLLDFLQLEGIEATGAANGIEALRHIAITPTPPDVVITDVAMPGIDGLTLAGELTKRIPQLAIIVMSAALIPPEQFGYSFVAKPFNLDTLLDAIEDVLEPRLSSSQFE